MVFSFLIPSAQHQHFGAGAGYFPCCKSLPLFWRYGFGDGARGASRDAVLSTLVRNHAVLQPEFSALDVVFKTGASALQKYCPKHPCSTYPSLPLHLAWHFAPRSAPKASPEVKRAERDIAPANRLLSRNAISQLWCSFRDSQRQKSARKCIP